MMMNGQLCIIIQKIKFDIIYQIIIIRFEKKILISLDLIIHITEAKFIRQMKEERERELIKNHIMYRIIERVIHINFQNANYP